MYFVLLFVLSWIWFFFQADKTRVRELYGAAIYASFLGLLTDLIMVHYQVWSYHGLPHSDYVIPLLLDFGIYPVVAYLFVQNVPESWSGIFTRTIIWTIFSVILEWITLRLGFINHHMWWNLWFSLVSDIAIYLSIAGLYRFYRPAYIA